MDAMDNQGLVRQNNVLKKTERQSSLDLALARCMDQVSQIYKTEMLPGEIRVWQHTFSRERPEALLWGFRKYFTVGTFPPKPADIAKLIREERESPYFEGWDSDLETSPVGVGDSQYRQLAEASRKEFFDSPEYQQFLERMKLEHGI